MDSLGQVVDAVIMPVAPHAAVIPWKYYHVGKMTSQRLYSYCITSIDLRLIHIRLIDYTEAINLLDYSAIVIPVTRADKEIDKFDHTYIPTNERDRKNHEACKSSFLASPFPSTEYYDPSPYPLMSRHLYADDPEMYHGAPVGIQLVARKYDEEKVWALGKMVHAALQNAGVQ